MSRTEIANYLAMAVETVSRLFGEFEAEGIMDVNRRTIKILDLERLLEIAKFENAFETTTLRKAG